MTLSTGSPFRNWEGRGPLSLFPRVWLHSIGGELNNVWLPNFRNAPGLQSKRDLAILSR